MNQVDAASEILLTIEFDGKYSKVRFHPFMKQKTIAEKSVRNVIKTHKEYMDSTQKMTMNGTRNVHDRIRMMDGNKTTLTEIVLSNLVNKQRYVHSTAEVKGVLTLLYHKKYSAHMIPWKN